MATNHTNYDPLRNPQVDYERADLSARGILLFLIGLLIAGVFIELVLWGMFRFMARSEVLFAPSQMNPMMRAEQGARAGGSRVVLQNAPAVNLDVFPEPRLQAHDAADMGRFLKSEQELLNREAAVRGFGAGAIHIPISIGDEVDGGARIAGAAESAAARGEYANRSRQSEDAGHTSWTAGADGRNWRWQRAEAAGKDALRSHCTIRTFDFGGHVGRRAAALVLSGQERAARHPSRSPLIWRTSASISGSISKCRLICNSKTKPARTVKLGDYFPYRPASHSEPGVLHLPNALRRRIGGRGQRAQPSSKFTPGKEYEIVSVSFNPDEGPKDAAKSKQIYIARMNEHLEHKTDGSGWHFLTGQQPQIKQLADAVGFHYHRDPQQPAVHSCRLES